MSKATQITVDTELNAFVAIIALDEPSNVIKPCDTLHFLGGILQTLVQDNYQS